MLQGQRREAKALEQEVSELLSEGGADVVEKSQVSDVPVQAGTPIHGQVESSYASAAFCVLVEKVREHLVDAFSAIRSGT